jgi:hypothetical protein
MANVIRIKRSTVTAAPTSLLEGELAYSELSGNLFIGTSGSTQKVIGGDEGVQDIVGAMVTGNTETGIDVTYVDGGVGAGKLNFALTADPTIDLAGDLGGTVTITDLATGNYSLDATIQTDAVQRLMVNTDLITGQTALAENPDPDVDFVLIYDNDAGIYKKIAPKYLGATTLGDLDNVGTDTITSGNIMIADGTDWDSVAVTGDVLIDSTGDTQIQADKVGAVELGVTAGAATASRALVVDASKDINLGTGDLTATDITGTLQTAAQTNVTTVGTLNGVTIAGTQIIDMGANKVTNVAEPTQDTDAATKFYVDAVKTGLDVKASVRAATTVNGTLATAYANNIVIDGVTLATGDRILIKDQTASAENGIYVVQASGAPARATDADVNAEVTGGMFTFVEEGTANADAGFVLATNGAIVVGTTDLSFVQFSGAGQVTAGDALSKTGNTLDVNVDDSSIEVSGDALQVKALGITNAMIAATTIDLTAKVTGTLPVANGGTGLATITANHLVYGNGSSAVTTLTPGTFDAGNSVGQILSVNAAGTPVWTDTIDGGTF